MINKNKFEQIKRDIEIILSKSQLSEQDTYLTLTLIRSEYMSKFRFNKLFGKLKKQKVTADNSS